MGARITLAALAALLLAADASAITFHANLDACLTDSVAVTRLLSIGIPALGDSAIEPYYGAKLKRIAGNTGVAIAGLSGGGNWAAAARPSSYRAQPWSSDENRLLLEQSATPKKLILDGKSFAAIKSETNCAPLDSASIGMIRWHPAEAGIAIAWNRDHNKLTWFNSSTCVTAKSFQIPIGGTTAARRDSADFGITEDGTISDDGRFIALVTRYKRTTSAEKAANALHSDTLVLVNMQKGGAGEVGGYYTLPPLPSTWASSSNGQIASVGVSTSGSYVVVKYAGTPAYQRVFHRGADASLDTTSLAVFPHAMAAAGLRMKAAQDSTLGWIACMDGADFNTTSSSVEVLVGNERDVANSGDSNQGWDESQNGAQSDSGGVVMVELATGLHRHVTWGRSRLTGALEAEVAHTSGRAYSRRNWQLVTYAETANPWYKGEIAYWYLDGDFSSAHPTRRVMRIGQARSDIAATVTSEPDAVPSPAGSRILFASNFCEPSCVGPGDTDVKAYVYDLRTPATKRIWMSATSPDSNYTGYSATYPAKLIQRVARLHGAHNGSNVVVSLGPGTYSAFPSTNYTPLGGKRMSWYGDLANPSTTIIGASATIDVPYVTIRGVRINGDMAFNHPAKHDSLGSSILTGWFDMDGADDCTFADNTFLTTQITMARYPLKVENAATVRDTFVRNVMVNLTANGGEPGLYMGTCRKAGTADPPWYRRLVDSLYFRDNRVTITNSSATGGTALWKMFHVRHSQFIGNRFTLTNNSTGTTCDECDFAMVLRDSSFGNDFSRDTIIARGSGNNQLLFTDSGAHPKTVHSITVDSCYISVKNSNPAKYALYFQDAIDRDVFTYNVIVSEGGAQTIHIDDWRGTNVFDHNTIVGDRGSSTTRNSGIFGVDHHGFQISTWGSLTGTDSVKITNNAIYSTRPAAIGQASSNTEACRWFDLHDYDGLNTNETAMKARLVSDWNAYFTASYGATRGDRSIGITLPLSADGNELSVPGNGGPFETRYPKKDSLSVFGPMQFDLGGPDSIAANGDSLFNPAPGPLSILIGNGKSGSDIGAVTAYAVPKLRSDLDQYLNDQLQVNNNGPLNVYKSAETIGLPDTVYVYLTNEGGAEIEVGGMVDGDSADGFTPSFSSTTIAVGATETVRIIVNPPSAATRFPGWTFHTNDPKRPTFAFWMNFNDSGPPRGGPGGP
ncbi:MAG: hypothetical protein RI885_2277 [Actinomycetota bacterium]|jgi:hypothetical protein